MEKPVIHTALLRVLFGLGVLLTSGCGLSPDAASPTGVPAGWLGTPELSPMDVVDPTTADQTKPTILPPSIPVYLDQCPQPSPLVPGVLPSSGGLLFIPPRESNSESGDPLFSLALGSLAIEKVAEIPAVYLPWTALFDSPSGSLFVGAPLSSPSKILWVIGSRSSVESELTVGVPWRRLAGWDQKTGVLTIELFPQEGEGSVTLSYLLLNMDTGDSQRRSTQLTLPGYSPVDVDFSRSYYSVSPNSDLVVYTATPDDSGPQIVLYELPAGQMLWERSLPYYLSLPTPAWDGQGEKVAIAFFGEQSGARYSLVILDLLGKTRIMLSPVPNVPQNGWVNHLSWSPDGRYLYYVVGDMPYLGGDDYILDSYTATVRPVCSGLQVRSTSGEWLNGLPHTLAFTHLPAPDTQSLAVLDLENWAYWSPHSIGVVNPINGYRILGVIGPSE